MSVLTADQRADLLETHVVAPHLDRGEPVEVERDEDPAFSWKSAAILAVAVFVAALFGIYSRPAGFTASWWPANPLVVGLMLQHRRFRHPVCFAAAFLGYFSADLLTGSRLDVNLAMNVTNIIAIAAGLGTARFILRPHDLKLGSPDAVMRLFLVAIIAAAITANVGMVASNLAFDEMLPDAWRGWFASEISNSLAILPVVLTAPVLTWPPIARDRYRKYRRAHDWEYIWQYVTIPVTLFGALVVGGPGAMLFPLPALLWCALRTSVFQTAVLTLLTTASLNVFVAMEWLTLADPESIMYTKVSAQLGLSLMVVGPLVVAAATEARRKLLEELRRRATRDALTGVLTRRAFFDDADMLLQFLGTRNRTVGVLMLDIDHFKRINDTYGHPAGDKVLESFAEIVAGCLRKGDLLGRIGGEEFAVVLPAVAAEDAVSVSERIRTAVEASSIVYREETISVTVSIGATTGLPGAGLAALLSRADEALYQAKADGRNRVYSLAPGSAGPLASDAIITDVRSA